MARAKLTGLCLNGSETRYPTTDWEVELESDQTSPQYGLSRRRPLRDCDGTVF